MSCLLELIPEGTFYLRTFGCQMNEHDSERIHGMLRAEGLQRVERPEEADVLVYNTCSIREKADSRLLGNLGVARRLKAAGRTRAVVVTGCLAQSRREAFLAERPEVDVLVGPQSLEGLPRLLAGFLEGRGLAVAFAEQSAGWSSSLPRARKPGPTAWVQIMTGCTNYCAYCIVPYVRGPESSRPADDILSEVRSLVAEGVREVTLLGQNVNAYGREPGFPGAEQFSDLLLALEAVEGLERIRFMTSHPKDVSPRLIEAVASCSKVCEHLHLPVQSGSDRVLAAMGRRYTRAGYARLVAALRDSVPQLALTTDLIVAFPGESEQDFQETLSLVRDCDFDTAFTFIYSPRPGTRAAQLPQRSDRATAERRVNQLIDLVQAQAAGKNAQLVGARQEVLVEGINANGQRWGRTRGFKLVNFEGSAQPGSLVQVGIGGSTSSGLTGRQLDPAPGGLPGGSLPAERGGRAPGREDAYAAG